MFVGLTPREAAVLRVFIAHQRSAWTFAAMTDCAPGLSPPPADIYIVDVQAARLMPWTSMSDDRIAAWPGNAAVIFIHPRLADSWTGMSNESPDGKPIVWLSRPYGSTQVNNALVDAIGRRTRVVGGDSATPAILRPPVSPVAVAPKTPPPQAIARSVTQPNGGTDDLGFGVTTVAGRTTSSDLVSLVALFPALQHQQSLLHGIARMIVDPRIYEVQLTANLALILHSAEEWVAGDAAIPIMDHLQRNPRLASQVSARPIGSSEAWDRVNVQRATKRALDTFMWRWAATCVQPGDLAMSGDAVFWLRATPNFTRLPDVTDLDLRIAAVSLRRPCRISWLKRTFPDQADNRIERFILLSTLAGLAQVRQINERETTVAASPTTTTSRNSKWGLFRAILDKLYRNAG